MTTYPTHPLATARSLRTCRPTALALVAALGAASCGEDTPGLEVQISLAGPALADGSAGARVIDTDSGYRVTLTKGYVAVGSVEIVPCEGGDDMAWLPRQLGFFSKAYAHTAGSPTELGVPAVLSLVSAGRSEIGLLAPPPDRYCEVNVVLAAADDDALYMPSDADMVGKSLYLEGTYQAEDAAQPVPFTVSATLGSSVSLAHEAVSLSPEHPRRELVIAPVLERWFDTVDFMDASPDTIARRVLEQARVSMEVSFR